MRVSEIADLAGVSVRTVRHYHAIGIMPEPPTAGAWRDYGIDDAARLLRIRTLAEAGVPLSEIPALLDGEGPSHGADGLAAAIASVDERIAKLEKRRDSLVRLRDSADGGSAETIPANLAAVYDAIEAELETAGDLRALRLVRRERRLVGIAAHLGHIGDDLVAFLCHADPREVAEYCRDVAALEDPGWTDADVRELVDRGFAIVGRYGDVPGSLVAPLRWFAVNRLARTLVCSAYPAPGQRRFVELAFDRLGAELRRLHDERA